MNRCWNGVDSTRLFVRNKSEIFCLMKGNVYHTVEKSCSRRKFITDKKNFDRSWTENPWTEKKKKKSLIRSFIFLTKHGAPKTITSHDLVVRYGWTRATHEFPAEPIIENHCPIYRFAGLSDGGSFPVPYPRLFVCSTGRPVSVSHLSSSSPSIHLPGRK